jgi:hypothetical protein
MQDGSKLARLAVGLIVATMGAACALPASATPPRPGQEGPSAAAVAAWSASYRAQGKVYHAGLSRPTTLPSRAAVQVWSDSYRAKADVYRQQQLEQAERDAAAFHLDDAVIGGGIVLALTALTAAGFVVVRSRRLDAVGSS